MQPPQPAPVLILFSGGVDSTLIAALAHRCLPPEVPIDLSNVCFNGGRSADRLAARSAVLELAAFAPQRQWRLIEVDSTLQEVDQHREHILRLLHPAGTVMDYNIGAALWLAARARGKLLQVPALVGSGATGLYGSAARVVLLGHGADEQCGGYGRHRTCFRNHSWSGLAEELAVDMRRLWLRLIADHGREGRHPFLDEHVMTHLLDMPLELLADLSKPPGVGDKHILREALKSLGLPVAAARVKRAIQFGSCIGKLSNTRDWGSNRKANKQSAGQHIVRAWGEEPLHNGDPSRWTPKLDAVAPEAADPASALRCVLDVVRERNLDGMLEFCPDELIDRLVAHRKEAGSAEDVGIEDFLKNSSNGLLDTYALRNLVMTAPRSVQVLSAMHVRPETYLQRCAIVSPSGEECVLTFHMALQETSECQYRGPPLLFKQWMLQSVTGECSSDELPSHPSPSFPPEAVVEAQLAALREGRVASVFAHASPENKAATGPVENFAAMLHHNPVYQPLMGHVHAETVSRLQASETSYLEVVKVTPASRKCPKPAAGLKHHSGKFRPQQHQGCMQQEVRPLLFMWFVSRQGEHSTWANCWMTDAVQLVNVMPANFTR
eukprot:gene4225-4474_t